jgi:hypothetical protein
LSHRQWDAFLAECEHRDQPSALGRIHAKKLFQVIVRILAEAKYLEFISTDGSDAAHAAPQGIAYLKRLGDEETLARMEAKA